MPLFSFLWDTFRPPCSATISRAWSSTHMDGKLRAFHYWNNVYVARDGTGRYLTPWGLNFRFLGHSEAECKEGGRTP